MSVHPHLPRPDVQLQHPEWSKAAVIYQVNQRQLTPEGTFRAAEAHLPRIRDLGADIIWLMPINLIGQLHRKGTLGSPYAVQDHLAVNPDLGTLEDLRHFVATAHEHGLRVIVDWVANHTSWDNVLVGEHPEWYSRDWKGSFHPTPWWDWDDVIDLDYSHEGLRRYMTEAMKFWVREADIDGYRCDVAGYVPTDFWENLRAELDAIKPVFMLAEWESRELHTRAFDLTYAWSWSEAMHKIAQGESDLGPLVVYYAWNEKAWPRDSMRMTFVSNHDLNAWEGTEYERFGDALPAAIALSVVGDGMPLIYNGQEAGSDRRLAFFTKDQITWREDPQGELYRALIALKKEHHALWNGRWGAPMIRVPNSNESAVLSFVRAQEDDVVLAVFNLSSEEQTVSFGDGPHHGAYTDAFSGESMTVGASTSLTLPAWGYRVLTR